MRTLGRTIGLSLLGTLLLVPGAPAVAQEEPAPDEYVTEELPPYAAEEWEEAEAEAEDRAARQQQGEQALDDARNLPPPPDGARVEAVPESDADRGDVQFDDFYQGLSEHGTWVETPEYGYVFVPYRQTQVSDWRPYTYGRWVWTSYGWTWVSEEPFGWATYHYGRWTFMSGYGWAWVPGYTWGPAWVAWRYGPDAVGWAPLYPGYVSVTVGYPVYYSHWVYIGPSFFYSYPVHRHYYHGHHHHYYSNTHYASYWRHGSGRGSVYSGPPRSYVGRYSGVPIREARVQTVARPNAAGVVGRPGQAPSRVGIYRPDARNAVRPDRLAPSRSGGSRVAPPQNRLAPAGSGLLASRGAAGRVTAPGRSDLVGTPGGRPSPQGRVTQPGAIRDPRAPRVQPGDRPPAPADRSRAASRGYPNPDVTAPQPPRGVPAPREKITTPQGQAPRSVTPRGQTAPRLQAPTQRSQPMPRIQAPTQRSQQAPRLQAPTQRSQPMPRIQPPPRSAAPRMQPAPRSSAPRIQSAPRSSGPRVAPAPSRSSGGSRSSGPSRSAPRPSGPSRSAPRPAGGSGGSHGGR